MTSVVIAAMELKRKDTTAWEGKGGEGGSRGRRGGREADMKDTPSSSSFRRRCQPCISEHWLLCDEWLPALTSDLHAPQVNIPACGKKSVLGNRIIHRGADAQQQYAQQEFAVTVMIMFLF